ncbi:MAG: type II secretion system major pseudopilin GspG [Phycisphaerales bacterium]|nr:type II secretion system major pseudopilin GspG [Phycisphaerales bacterium]
MNRNRVRGRRRRGFTLFEVLMVIVILGVLAAVIVPSFMNTGEQAKKDLAAQQVSTALRTPLELFKTHTGRYPTSEEGLKVLFERPSDETISQKWAGPYLQNADVKDPWSRALIYNSPGQYNQGSYDLSSPGPDGQPGTDDDITNWKRG